MYILVAASAYHAASLLIQMNPLRRMSCHRPDVLVCCECDVGSGFWCLRGEAMGDDSYRGLLAQTISVSLPVRGEAVQLLPSRCILNAREQ